MTLQIKDLRITEKTMSILDSTHLYDQYLITIVICDRMDGGVPKDPKLIEAWVKASTGHNDEQTKQQVADHLPDIAAAGDEAAAGMWCGFKEHVDRKYIEPRQIKAMLRECATVLGITKKKRGSRQIIQHGFEVKGCEDANRVYIEVCEPAMYEKAIHVMTAQGPRSAIKRNDCVGAGSKLTFQVWILKTQPQETRHIGEADLKEMFSLAQENGLGANRSQGSGKFDVTAFEKLDDKAK